MRIERDIHNNPTRQVEVQEQLRRDYGVQATGAVVGSDYHDDWCNAPYVQWNHPDLKRIVRLRLLSDPGYPQWDISYCYGLMKDGSHVRVQLPMLNLPRSRNGKAMWACLYQYGNRDNVRVNALFAGADISTLC